MVCQAGKGLTSGIYSLIQDVWRRCLNLLPYVNMARTITFDEESILKQTPNLLMAWKHRIVRKYIPILYRSSSLRYLFSGNSSKFWKPLTLKTSMCFYIWFPFIISKHDVHRKYQINYDQKWFLLQISLTGNVFKVKYKRKGYDLSYIF